MTRRLHVHATPEVGATLRLGPEARRHGRVLRLGRGERLVLFDGRGGEWEAELLAWDRDSLSVRVLSRAEPGPTRESPLRLEIAQGLARGGRFEEALQAGTELGVAAFHPVAFERSAVDPGAGSLRASRWEAVTREAARQCGRAVAPTVSVPRPARDLLAHPPEADLRLLLVPGALPLGSALPSGGTPPRTALLVVGPEGGITAEERDAARRGGMVEVGLGPRVLRTEHAGAAAAAVLQYLFGDLGGEPP